MKKSFLIILLAMLIISCEDDEFKQDLYTYNFYQNKELIISSESGSYMKTGSMKTGANVVFEYKFEAYDDKDIADDEYTETIMFEIDPSLEKFAYLEDDLALINPVLTQYCYCSFPDSEEKNVAPVGRITGRKISSKEWYIKIVVTFYGDEEKYVEGKFLLN